MKTDDTNDWIQLWALRILEPDKYLNRFVRKEDFSDDDAARALGLDEWLDDEQPFDRAKIKMEIRRRHAELEANSKGIHPPQHCRENIATMGRLLSLNAIECRLLLFLACAKNNPLVKTVMSNLGMLDRSDHAILLSHVTKIPLRQVKDIIAGNSTLLSACIVKWTQFPRSGTRLEITIDALAEKLLQDGFSVEEVLRDTVIPAPATELTFRDYPHARETLGNLRPYLRRTLQGKDTGSNVLIYGKPGTGKSELSRLLARDMRVRLYEVASTDQIGDPIPGVKRLEALRAAQVIFGRQRAMLVFDEAEDVFGSHSIFRPSVASGRKAWMNRMLENNAIPTIWISNSIQGLDSAFARRFDFVFALEPPPRSQRAQSYKRICKRLISEPTLAKITCCDAVTPALVARARDVVERTPAAANRSNADASFLHLLGNTLKAQGFGPDIIERSAVSDPDGFSLNYIHCSSPLEPVVTALKEGNACRMCLYGPPGTGKTSFGYWLSHRLGKPLRVEKASSLMSAWMGETEKAIANAFHKARLDRAILLIDEVDSFLSDRRRAVRSWEITQVNELLTQMESFDGLFIASTNAMDTLDPAAFRRFDLKIHFDYLTAEQTGQLLDDFCKRLKIGQPGPEEQEIIRDLTNATPGDFSNAARQHPFRRYATPAHFAEAVAAECAMKEGGLKAKLGF